MQPETEILGKHTWKDISDANYLVWLGFDTDHPLLIKPPFSTTGENIMSINAKLQQFGKLIL